MCFAPLFGSSIILTFLIASTIDPKCAGGLSGLEVGNIPFGGGSGLYLWPPKGEGDEIAGATEESTTTMAITVQTMESFKMSSRSLPGAKADTRDEGREWSEREREECF